MPIASYDYDKLKNEKVIYVYLRDGASFRLIDFEFTPTHLKGVIIQENLVQKEITIPLENIDYIVVEKTEVTFVGLMQGVLIVVGAAALLVVILCAIASSSDQ